MGSRPEPVLTWWLGDTFLPGSRPGRPDISSSASPGPSANISRSVLSFTPSWLEDGAMLTCRAENTQLEGEGGAVQDSWRLAVHCECCTRRTAALTNLTAVAPIISLRLGLELGSDAIEEGKDVYFECRIKANPDIDKIGWTHNVKFHYN